MTVEGASALNRVRWSSGGKEVAVGDSEGRVWIYDTGEVWMTFTSLDIILKKAEQKKNESELPCVDVFTQLPAPPGCILCDPTPFGNGLHMTRPSPHNSRPSFPRLHALMCGALWLGSSHQSGAAPLNLASFCCVASWREARLSRWPPRWVDVNVEPWK